MHSYRVGRRASLGAKRQLFKRYVAGNFGLVEMGARRMVSPTAFSSESIPNQAGPGKTCPMIGASSLQVPASAISSRL